MANEIVRIQVREDSADHDWVDVGHKAGDAALPISGTFEASIDTTGLATDAKQDTMVSSLTLIDASLNDIETAVEQLAAGTESESVRVNGVTVTVKRAKISAASSGENTLVAAVTSKKIRVLSLALISNGAVDLYFNNATDGGIFGDSTNKVDVQQSTGFVLPHNPHGWFQTGTNNEALRINLSGAIAVAGSLTYIEV